MQFMFHWCDDMWLSKLFFQQNHSLFYCTTCDIHYFLSKVFIQKGYWYLTSACFSKSPFFVFLPMNVCIKKALFPHYPHWCNIIVCSVSLFRHHCGAGRVSASEAGAHTECRGPGPGVAISPHKHVTIVTRHPGSNHTEKDQPPS